MKNTKNNLYREEQIEIMKKILEHIGINKLQRDSCSLEPNDMVLLNVYSAGKVENIHTCIVEFETYDTKFQKITFEEQDLVNDFKQKFIGQIFVKNQKIWCIFGNYYLIYKFTSFSSISFTPYTASDRVQNIERGIVTSNTNFKFVVQKDKEKFLTLKENDERIKIFDPNWSFSDMGIGGLDKEFNTLFRRAFASRLFPPAIIEQLGIKHVKGLLLYGPPGTGKTLIAREIGKILKGKPPKVVNGPEILNKFVGQAEENIRNLFKEAEQEQLEKKEKSSLHVIIFDEIDAICKTRGTVSGVGVHDTVVNQLLSKIDGVNSLNNILVIGMTNRKDMLDPALLRPGRFEIHIEIVSVFCSLIRFPWKPLYAHLSNFFFFSMYVVN